MKIPALSTTTSIIILVVFFGAIYYFGKPSNEVPIPSSVDSNPPTPNDDKAVDLSLIEEKSYKASDDYITFSVSYPRFKNAGEEFNKKIEDLVMGEVEAQKNYAKEAWEGRYNTSTDGSVSKLPKADEKFSVIVAYKSGSLFPAQVNNNFISVLLAISGYSGGAHGFQNSHSFNYDVVNQKEIVLKDLFPNDPNYLRTISDFSRAELKKQFKDRLDLASGEEFPEGVLDMLNTGTEPKIENFSIFTFDSDHIIFNFAEYQVAPYAMGESTISMPRK